MGKIIQELKMTNHARVRLEERKDAEMKYNTKNLMRSSVKWYNRDDLIFDCALYRHSCYTTRKSKQLGYITDGDIEVIYNKNTHTAITVLEVKDKFKPITQFLKPAEVEKIKEKEEKQKMTEVTELKPICLDCGKEVEPQDLKDHICSKCRRRKQNMKARHKEYVRYLDLDDKEKARIDAFIARQAKISTHKYSRDKKKEEEEKVVLTAPDAEGYYTAKAEQTPVTAHQMIRPDMILQDQFNFIKILRECGCEIPEDNLSEVLDVLISTDKLKDIFMTIADDTNQQAILDLEQALNVIERKLQHDWEYNGFQESDDIKFKSFLTWRRVLKGAIFFWKKLYQTNALIEVQRAWNSYTTDPNDKILLAGDRIDSTLKRFQITTESVSTIFNTKRPFTRVFYATDKDKAYEMFVKWMADRQLHENKSKTVIVELKSEGEDGRES